MDFTALKERLEQNNFTVSTFATGAEAAKYLNEVIDGKTVGFGSSLTCKELDLHKTLPTHNEFYYHSMAENPLEAFAKAAQAQVYICSANAIAAKEGALVNIDGNGNRVSNTLFNHQKVYIVAGRNKIMPDLEQAVWRARNVAAPKNAQRLKRKTPCAAKGDKCYDCNSPERICAGLVIHWRKMYTMEMEIVLIDEDLGL